MGPSGAQWRPVAGKPAQLFRQTASFTNPLCPTTPNDNNSDNKKKGEYGKKKTSEHNKTEDNKTNNIDNNKKSVKAGKGKETETEKTETKYNHENNGQKEKTHATNMSVKKKNTIWGVRFIRIIKRKGI